MLKRFKISSQTPNIPTFPIKWLSYFHIKTIF